MTPDVLRANVERTVAAMKAQTGYGPGEPTNMCHSLIVGSLTGEDVIFSATRTGPEQVALERAHGLFLHPIYEKPPKTKMYWQAIMPSLLKLELVGAPIEAVVVFDSSQLDRRTHVVAVVPDGGNAPYRIVDSLLPRAWATLDTTHDAADYMRARFTGEKTRIFVAPTKNLF